MNKQILLDSLALESIKSTKEAAAKFVDSAKFVKAATKFVEAAKFVKAATKFAVKVTPEFGEATAKFVEAAAKSSAAAKTAELVKFLELEGLRTGGQRYNLKIKLFRGNY
jgi:hypothetical protein